VYQSSKGSILWIQNIYRGLSVKHSKLLYQKGAEIKDFSLCMAVKFSERWISFIPQTWWELYRKGTNMPRLLRDSSATICHMRKSSSTETDLKKFDFQTSRNSIAELLAVRLSN